MVRHRRQHLVVGSTSTGTFRRRRLAPCMHYNIFIELNRIQLHDRLGWHRGQL